MRSTKRIEYGYVVFSGRTMSNSEVDAYNRVQQRIEACQDAGVPASESLLNESHRIIAQAAYRAEGWS